MKVFELNVPTYYDRTHQEFSDGAESFAPPYQMITGHEDEGLRVTLDNPGDHKPELVFERRKHGWMVFINHDPNDDPAGYLQLHDDGRMCLLQDFAGNKIEVVERGGDGLDLD